MGDTITHEERMKEVAAVRLRAAAQWAQLHASAKPLFFKRMGKGKNFLIVRIDWPGVLTVADADTGCILAVSEPGRPDVLADYNTSPR